MNKISTHKTIEAVSTGAEQLWNGNYVNIMVANFLIYFAFYLLTPILPIYLSEQFGAGKDSIGIVLSGYTIAGLLTRPFCGYIVDSFARRKVLMACTFTFFILFAGYAGAGTLLLFALLRTIHGIPYGAVQVANSTVAIDVLPASRRSEGLGFFGLSGNIAMAFAPSAGIWVQQVTGSFASLFWLTFVIAGLGVWTASYVKLPLRESHRNKSKMSFDRFFLTRAWLMAINITFFSFCFGVTSNYIAIYSKEELGMTSGTGVYFALLACGLLLSRVQGAKALRTGRLTYNCGMGILVSIVGYTLFLTVHAMWAYYLSALLVGLGNGHMYPAFLNMFVNMARSNERGTANASIITSWDVGFGLGILIGGIVAEHSSYAAAFWLGNIINAVGIVLFFSATKSFFRQRTLNARVN